MDVATSTVSTAFTNGVPLRKIIALCANQSSM